MTSGLAVGRIGAVSLDKAIHEEQERRRVLEEEQRRARHEEAARNQREQEERTSKEAADRREPDELIADFLTRMVLIKPRSRSRVS